MKFILNQFCLRDKMIAGSSAGRELEHFAPKLMVQSYSIRYGGMSGIGFRIKML